MGKPVIVYDYPKDIKAFYMRLNDDGQTVAAMDVLAPGIGEIIGGSQREERLEVLDHPDGVWACENHFQCTRVCPRGIKITKNINLSKRRITKAREEGK